MVDHRPIVEALRLENLLKRQRKRVLRLAEDLEDAELTRQVLERELARLRCVAEPVACEWPPKACASPPTATVRPPDSQDRDGEAAEPGGQGVDDPSRRRTVARSGETGRQPTASEVPDGPRAASAVSHAPSGTAGATSARSGDGTAPTSAHASAPVTPPEPGRGLGGDYNRRSELAAAESRLAHAVRRGSAFGKQAIDETGKRYGKLTVIERAPSIGPKARWRCGCDCGEQRLVDGNFLRNGRITACAKCAPAKTCSHCGEAGHNVRGCPALGAEAETPTAAPSKRCIQCGETKPLSEFYGHPSGKGQSRCKACDNASRSARAGHEVGAKRGPKPKFTCFKCSSMPSRVEGVRCLGCGLEAERPVRATDFTSGESPLGRAS